VVACFVGAKAAAEATREARMAVFMVVFGKLRLSISYNEEIMIPK
jgi:hypothetical protein